VQRFLVLRFLEIAPNLGRIIASRSEEIEAAALSLGIDYSREPSGGGNRLPRAVSVVERLESDRILRSARELKALFDEVWPEISVRHGRPIRENVWMAPPGEEGGGRWTPYEEQTCLVDTWAAIKAALARRGKDFHELKSMSAVAATGLAKKSARK